MLVCKKGRGYRYKSKAALAKQQKALIALYADERAQKYQGEEKFMNILHPFEESGKHTGKKSSPFQKALIECINLKGGSATEEELLQHIKEKWDIIVKYSDRGFLMEPNLRVIRLNCAVKKKARHLFLKDPSRENAWMINSTPRKSPSKRSINVPHRTASSIEEYQDYFVDNYDTSSHEEPEEQHEKDHIHLLEDEILKFLKEYHFPLHFDDIVKKVKEFPEYESPFKNLPLSRRVRASLISLKCRGKISQIPNENLWVLSEYNSTYDRQTTLDNYRNDKLKTMSLSELYSSYKELGIF